MIGAALPALVVLAAAAARVLFPPDNAVVAGGGTVTVIAEADAERATLEVRVDGATVRGEPRRWAGPTVFHAPVRLQPGVNTLEIALQTAGGPDAVTRRRVFFASPLAKDAEPPAGFSRAPFHANEAAPCAGCHQTQPRATDAAPRAAAESTCFSCHAGLTKHREVHGPTAQWACTRCHDPASRPVRYATPQPVMPLCFSCHTEQKDRFYGSAYQHGPTATGRCTICHDPHGTENTFFLKRPPWALCTTCHAEKGTGRHVITWGPTGQGHPTRDKADPTRPGRELSCASCHDPHAAPNPKLWNFGAVLYLDLCRNCHKTILGG